MATLIRDKYKAYKAYKAEVNARFEQQRANKDEPNRIFAAIYDVVGEVPIEVEDKYVSVARIFDTTQEIPESYKGNKYVRTRRDEIVSLISYAAGCTFGRYSLDVEGLVLADAGDTVKDYLAKMPDPDHVTFMPDADNVLPITDDDAFGDDIVVRFVDFIRTVYCEEALEENLRYIADALSPPQRPPRARPFAPISWAASLPTTAPPTRSAPSTGWWTPARRTVSRPCSTCTAIAPTFESGNSLACETILRTATSAR